MKQLLMAALCLIAFSLQAQIYQTLSYTQPVLNTTNTYLNVQTTCVMPATNSSTTTIFDYSSGNITTVDSHTDMLGNTNHTIWSTDNGLEAIGTTTSTMFGTTTTIQPITYEPAVVEPINIWDPYNN